jgi:alcohol dehydrogenase
MLNGIYHNPTRIIFGSGSESHVGEEVRHFAGKVLLHYGSESLKKSGLHDRITKSLDACGLDYCELGGVKPNPRADLVYEGIEICRKHNIEFVLAVGGGSVIDSAKAIAIGVPWAGDFLEFFEGKQTVKSALKVGTVLTISGSGSESSMGAIITDTGRHMKLGCASPLMFPIFSILNPELTYTVNQYYTSVGIVDAISHILERYFTRTLSVDCTDRICEGLMKTLMKYAFLVKTKPDDYDIRSEIMWACKLAHDNVAGFGRKQDWAPHMIAHEIGSLYDIHHGALVGVIYPAWMQYVCRQNSEKFIQFAKRLFDIDTEIVGCDQAILLGIERFRQFLKSIDMATSLRDLGVRDRSSFQAIGVSCVRSMPSGTIGNYVRLSPQDICNILDSVF